MNFFKKTIAIFYILFTSSVFYLPKIIYWNLLSVIIYFKNLNVFVDVIYLFIYFSEFKTRNAFYSFGCKNTFILKKLAILKFRFITSYNICSLLNKSLIFITTKHSVGKLNVQLLHFFSLVKPVFFSYVSGYYRFLSFFIALFRRSFGFGYIYIYGFLVVLVIDSLIIDDEPLWEPIEWSMVQSWILFIFIFAWIAENLITSRYGSYTGRDKRVWMSWYKTFWMIEGFYILNYGIVCVFVIVPFYYETNYSLSFVYSWWHWYTRVFFFKFISVYSLVLVLANLLQTSVNWKNWKKSFFFVILVNIFLSYLLYTHFIITFFGYFTDPIWYQKVRPVDYIQLSHEPSRWGWGTSKKDHFTYHNVKTVFWFKNDGPFVSSFLLFHLFLFVSLFLTYFWWISLFRKVFSTKEISFTFLTYCVSSLRQFFYFFLFMYIFVFISFLSNYWRLPVDTAFTLNSTSWFSNFFNILYYYPSFFISIFFQCYL